MKIHAIVFGAIAIAFAGWAPAPAFARTLEAVASFSILADVVRQVGGEHVHVRSLVPPNGDPHDFEPSPNHARTLKSADISFISGDGLESWFKRLAKASGYPGEPVVVSAGVKTLNMDEDGETVTDPHVWNSIPNVVIWVETIAKALAQADPEHAADFKANKARYTKEITDLDAYAHAKLDVIPKEKRKILTSHDAFGYFGKEYGVTFLSPLALSTETEASAADVAKLIDQIRKERVRVYFIENSNDPRLVKQIAEATGAEPGGELYVESLSKPGGPASTYVEMFRNNVDLIADALSKGGA